MKKIINNSQASGVFEEIGSDGWYKIALTVEGGAIDAGVAVELQRKDNDSPDAESRAVTQNGAAVVLTQADPERLVAVDSDEMIRATQSGGTTNITVTANRFDAA